jgi:hypothetical protein
MKADNSKMPPMKNAIVPIILKVVDPSATIIHPFIAATKKKMIAAMPNIQRFVSFFDIANSPRSLIHGIA